MRVALVCAACALLVGQDERVVPVHEEPRHRLVFETPGTRVLDVQIPPGDTTLYHTHSDPILYVTISTSQTRSQTLGGEWSAADGAAQTSGGKSTVSPSAVPVSPTVPPGRLMSVTRYATTPQTHRVNNVGASLFRLIGITNTSAGDEDPAPSASFNTTPETDNRWFRAYRHSLSAGPDAEHRHPNPVVVVLIAGTARLETSEAPPPALVQPGQFTFLESGATHRLYGTTADAQVIEVEIRRPR